MDYEKFRVYHKNELGGEDFDIKPVIISTPTYTPQPFNNSTSGNKGGNKNTLTQSRSAIYNNIAWREPERIEGLNFFNTGYSKSANIILR